MWEGHREIAHGGATAGYATYLTRFPDARISIAVFCNANDANPTMSARQIAALMLPSRRAEAPARAAADTAALRSLVGRYRDPMNDNLADFALRPDGLQLRTAVAGGIAWPLGGNRFRADNGATFEFLLSGGGRRVTMTDADGRAREYEEVVPPAAASLRLDEYTGSYRSPELDVRYDVIVDNGQLTLGFPPATRLRLAPLYRDGFVSDGRTVRFVRDPSGRVTGFLVFAGRVRGVRFDRDR
jgi:hypothetical protein